MFNRSDSGNKINRDHQRRGHNMKVLVIGANGQVGRKIVKELANSRHDATAMVRKEEQMDKLKEIGAENVVLANLEEDFSHAFDGVDPVIFAAGSGGSTGADKTVTVDLWGSVKAADYAKEKGIKRFVQLSSVGSGNPDEQGEEIKHYMVAKGVADRNLRQMDLDYTIVRPGLFLMMKQKEKLRHPMNFQMLVTNP